MAYTELVLNQPLYHFTNFDALSIILKTGQIRFSRADQTNDPFEVILARRAILEHLNAIVESEHLPGRKDILNRVIAAYETVCVPSKIYLSCWTDKVNSIPMWRLYGNEGTGVALGLRPRAFDGFDCRLTRVDYLDGGESILDAALNIARKANGEKIDAVLDSTGVSLTVRLIEATVSTKSTGWEYEREYRLSFSQEPDQYESIEEFVDKRLFKRLSAYSPTENQEVEDSQYLFQQFGKRMNDQIVREQSIAQVVLGPNCVLETVDVEDSIKSWGYQNFQVVRSELVWV